MVEVNGLRVRVQQDGPADAPALLLLHSIGTSLRIWDPVVAALAACFRVVRPDMRGHGGTAVTRGPGTMAQLGGDALGVLDALGIKAAHVAGLSIGGMVAQEAARQAPGRVLSLILMDTALAIPPAALWAERAAAVRANGMASIADAVLPRWVTPEAPSHTTAWLRDILLASPAEGYAAAAEAIGAADLSHGTSGLRVPTLVLVADGDQATPMASAQALAAPSPARNWKRSPAPPTFRSPSSRPRWPVPCCGSCDPTSTRRAWAYTARCWAPPMSSAPAPRSPTWTGISRPSSPAPPGAASGPGRISTAVPAACCPGPDGRPGPPRGVQAARPRQPQHRRTPEDIASC